ncbi:MAG: ATP-dependent zinc metalloprotease FtsH [candidate division WOR-3 bacterium]
MKKRNIKKIYKGNEDKAKWTIWIITLLLLLFLPNIIGIFTSQVKQIDYSTFYNELMNGKIKSVTIVERNISGEYKDGGQFKTIIPYDDNTLVQKMVEQNVKITVKIPSNFWGEVLPYVIPLITFFVLFYFFTRSISNSQNRAFTFGRSNAVMVLTPKVTFNDVAGAKEAKEELQEIIDFLKHPGKYIRLGGRIPKGVLLLGSPGTGKTLMAKAVAGEAKVPFFSISGSDFVEMFVGVGASRVRDLFQRAKANSPCIVFIDEIDAVGRHRGAGIGGGHDEREQTLNQLLVEMDGFQTDEAVIVMAATNRPDILDPALLRPGRFDRRIVIDRPDVKGREEIFVIHTRKIPLGKDVDFSILAKATPGFTGADIANMVNEAALLAARKDKNEVNMEEFEEAKDKILMGLARKSAVISESERKISAYHESGHVIVSKNLKNVDPVFKVTVIPRGMALGVTQFLPIDDRHMYSKNYLLDNLASLLGGRAAEILALGDITTGASNDIEKATEIAHKMVCEWGMSEKVGTIQYANPHDSIFLGREITQRKDFSEETARLIDSEVKKIVDEAMQRALNILKENLDKLNKMANYLLERETLDSDDIDRIMKGEELEPLKKDNTKKEVKNEEDV